MVEVPLAYQYLEILCVDVYFSKHKQRYIVVYRPPNVNLDYTRDLFLCLNALCETNSACCVCGDFNLPNIDWSNLSNGVPAAEEYLTDFIRQNGYHQMLLPRS